jgi:energy-coupling factor transporter ATP-binding protein EcfA2
MKLITGLIGREDLVEQIAREARKGRHLILTGPVGIGKSAVLEAVIDRLLLRQNRTVIHVGEQQAKGQFLEMARGAAGKRAAQTFCPGTGRRAGCRRSRGPGMGQAQAPSQPIEHPRSVRGDRPGAA